MSSCFFNCSQVPSEVQPYADVSGIGVIISFVATGWLVVIILIGYYIFAFQPELDPYRKDGAPSRRADKPNPLDQFFLQFVSRKYRQKAAVSDGENQLSHLEKSFNKCVLGMSDLQIVTGIAILVSGYTSLHCGISAYHWLLIVYLAWFSSITHLSALTFLRNYLYNHPGERLWRLISMSVCLFMLMVALAPTGNFDWQGSPNDVSPVVLPGAYAICHFNIPSNSDLASASASYSFGSMVISILLLIFGFTSRVFKLYEPLFTLVSGWRANLSKMYRTRLWNFQVSSGPNTHPFNWRRTLVHRPAVSVFLVLRLYLDMYSSMVSEVYWLLVSIIWGTIQLLNTRSSITDPSDGEWAFGQILPVLLLASPLMAIIENFYPEKEKSIHTQGVRTTQNVNQDTPNLLYRRTSTLQICESASSATDGLEDLAQDYYKAVPWFKDVIIIALSIIGFSTVEILYRAAARISVAETLLFTILWAIFIPFFVLSFYMLIALNLRRQNFTLRESYLKAVRVVCCMLVGLFITGIAWYDSGGFGSGGFGIGLINAMIMSSLFGFYVLASFTVSILLSRWDTS